MADDERPGWKMRDGTVIAIVDMEDTHLINACRMVLRRAPRTLQSEIEAGWQMLCTLQGEAAIDSVETDLNYLESVDPEDWAISCFPDLFKEADRRGLTTRISGENKYG